MSGRAAICNWADRPRHTDSSVRRRWSAIARRTTVWRAETHALRGMVGR